MKRFITDLLSSGTDVSSKRVASLVVLVNLILLTWVTTLTAFKVPIEIFDALLLFSGGGLGLTVIEKIFTKSDKTQ